MQLLATSALSLKFVKQCVVILSEVWRVFRKTQSKDLHFGREPINCWGYRANSANSASSLLHRKSLDRTSTLVTSSGTIRCAFT